MPSLCLNLSLAPRLAHPSSFLVLDLHDTNASTNHRSLVNQRCAGSREKKRFLPWSNKTSSNETDGQEIQGRPKDILPSPNRELHLGYLPPQGVVMAFSLEGTAQIHGRGPSTALCHNTQMGLPFSDAVYLRTVAAD